MLKIHKLIDIERITSSYNYEFKFLSPYSYMLNSIKNSFSKIKNSVRSKLRNNVEESLSELIYSSLEDIAEMDYKGYFRYMQSNIINCVAERPYIYQ